MAAYVNFTGTGDADEAAVLKLANTLLSGAGLKAFFALPDSFADPAGLDAQMVQCAVLSQATPAGLAAFAARGQGEAELIERLLEDTLLMRDMLVAGGAAGGQYGRAMQIYDEIKNRQ
eukprot:g5620.t1